MQCTNKFRSLLFSSAFSWSSVFRMRLVKCVKKSFYPGSIVFLLLTESITNLACKGGVFCSSSNDIIIGTNALQPSWTLKPTES